MQENLLNFNLRRDLSTKSSKQCHSEVVVAIDVHLARATEMNFTAIYFSKGWSYYSIQAINKHASHAEFSEIVLELTSTKEKV